MGACGCGDYSPDFKFKGPGDDWYVIQSYPGCDYCDTPAGVILYRFNPEDTALWSVEHLKEKKIPDGGFCIPIIHPEKLKLKCEEYLKGIADDMISDCFRDAVHESFMPIVGK